MNRRKDNLIQVFEHSTLRVDGETFKRHHFESLVKYNDKHNNKYFTIGYNKITFNQYVGVIQVKDLIIEILPKADKGNKDDIKKKWRDALLRMLHECRLIKLESLTNARLQLRSSSLLDLYFDAFLTEVEKLIRYGLTKKYRRVQNNLYSLKGKIAFNQHIRHNYIHKERFYSEYQTYDKNHLLNQILLKAVKTLSTLTNSPSLLSRAKKVTTDLDSIEETVIDRSSFENLHFDRNTDRYRYAIKLAKLVILNYSPDLKGGNDNVLAILFDMNSLFEKFIYRQLKKVERSRKDIKVREQVRKNFWGTRGIRPDILIKKASQTLVVDTKWKVLDTYSPSDDNLKQVFTYNLYYNASLSILLYPKVSLDAYTKKPFYPSEDIGREHSCKLAFVELFDEEDNLRKNLGDRIFKEVIQEELYANAV